MSQNCIWIVALGIVQPSVLLYEVIFLAAPDQFIASTTHIQHIPITFANRTTTNFLLFRLEGRKRTVLSFNLFMVLCNFRFVLGLPIWPKAPTQRHTLTWIMCETEEKIRGNVAQTLELSQDRNVFDRLKMKRREWKTE